MIHIGVIGGTGLTEMSEFTQWETQKIESPLGTPSADIQTGVYKGNRVSFLARHGVPHSIPPHLVNYRANIWALKEIGVTQIVSVNAVGGITEGMNAETLCIPHQIVDYSTGRESTFFDGLFRPLKHVDVSQPYDEDLRRQLIHAAEKAEIDLMRFGTYGVTQGPRLETAAEIQRMERDGCDVVGMTGMPEAALARELDIPYASISIVVNRAAGKFHGRITMEDIEKALEFGIEKARRLLLAYLDLV